MLFRFGYSFQPLVIGGGLFFRLNPDVLAYFKQGGQGWQTRLNDALQEYMKLHPDKL